jgi:hypothetical protein
VSDGRRLLPWLFAGGAGALAWWWLNVKKAGTAFGIALGLVKPGSRKPAIGAANYVTQYYPAGWQAYIKDLDFVTSKVINGTNKESGQWEAVQAAALQYGVPFHGFGWAYCRTHTEGAREGRAFADRSLELGLPAFWVNAERNWLGNQGAEPTSDPIGSMFALVEAFRAAAPNVALVYNCQTSWATNDPHFRANEAALVAAFDVYAPMIYAKENIGVVARAATSATPAMCPRWDSRSFRL